MSADKLKYYNMIVHLIRNNRLYEENAAIKNVWKKDNNIFFDIYFYRNQKSYVFDSVFIHDLLDLTNEKYYASPADFLADFQGGNSDLPPPDKNTPLVDKRLFEPIDVDLVIMTFVADCCSNFIPIKEKIIYDYIIEKIPATSSLSHQYVNTYLQGLQPDEARFYQALAAIKSATPDAAEDLLRECVKICLSDGQLHYAEKLYLAEIVQTLRDNGVDARVGL